MCNPKTKDAELIKRAILLAKNEKAESTTLDVVRTFPQDSLGSFDGEKISELQQASMDQRKRRLETFLRKIGSGTIHISIRVIGGDPPVEIIKAVVRDHYDLVMLTAEDSGPIKDRGLGVTFLRLIRRRPCPVWVVKSSSRSRYKSILAVQEGRPHSHGHS